MLVARFIVTLIIARFAAHGCANAFNREGAELMARVIAENFCGAARDYVCVAFAADPSACGMHWVDSCTLLKPGPSGCP